MPDVNVETFIRHTGFNLTTSEAARVTTLLSRARRSLDSQVNVPASIAGDELLDYQDAVCELAWLYWEGEKAGVMEIAAMPLTQLSLGTLFWTKSSGGFGAQMSMLPTLSRVMRRYGFGRSQKIVLEGELNYPG